MGPGFAEGLFIAMLPGLVAMVACNCMFGACATALASTHYPTSTAVLVGLAVCLGCSCCSAVMGAATNVVND